MVVVVVVVVVKHADHTPLYMLARDPPDVNEHPGTINSVHLADELVDVGLPVTEVTALYEVLELPCPPAASGVGELEGPEEVRCLLEVGAGGEDLVHEILDGKDIVLAERLLNDGVVGEGDALLVDLAVAALVDKFSDRLQVGLPGSDNEDNTNNRNVHNAPVSDIGLNQTEHLLGRLRDLDEDTIVDLKETEELEDFAGLRCNVVDTEDICLDLQEH